MKNKYFLHQIKRTNDVIEKGIVVKDTMEAAKQGFHAYLGAYAYGQNEKTDFVSCQVTDIESSGMALLNETWVKQEEEPEQE